MKNLFIDCEFVDLGSRIELISMGIVPENKEEPEFYSEYLGIGYILSKKDEWLRENVVPHLGSVDKLNNDRMRESLISYLGTESTRFWSYNRIDYNWLCFCSIFGSMMNIPDNVENCLFNLKQYSYYLGNPVYNKEHKNQHHALWDARWYRDLYLYLKQYEKDRLNI